MLFARGKPEDVARVPSALQGEPRTPPTRFEALALLATAKAPARKRALDSFYERWKDDHLVIDHWFRVQATAPLDGTLATVERLTQHPLFSLTNPNKVRSLLVNFATRNPVQFNRPDGAGYAFIAEWVRKLDADQPADGGPTRRRVPLLARAGTRPPRRGAQGARGARPHQGSFARRLRDRRARCWSSVVGV